MRIGTGVLSLAAALAASPAARADDVPTPSVRVVHIDWGSLDLPGRAAPDHATLSQRTTTMPEAGTWMGAWSPGMDRPLTVTSGDVGLTSSLTLRLAGAQDLFGEASAMRVGLAYWLTPAASRLAMALSLGYTEVSSITASGRGAFGELTLATTAGAFDLGAALRAQVALGGTSASSAEARAGAALRAGAFRFGAEALVERSLGYRAYAGPFASAQTPDGKLFVRAAPSLRLTGNGAPSAGRVSVGGAF